jgi:hypothetical protein
MARAVIAIEDVDFVFPPAEIGQPIALVGRESESLTRT